MADSSECREREIASPSSAHWRDYLELTKPRITWLILMSTAVGYFYGLGGTSAGWTFLSRLNWLGLLNTMMGTAFVDNLRDVPAFLTAGARDLVVPTGALAPALRSLLGAGQVDDSSPGRLGVIYPDGERFVDLFAYENAGHMVEMIEPADLAADVEGWVGAVHSGP